MKKTVILYAMIAAFIGAFIGSAHAQEFYFYESLPGLVESSSSTYPFCEGETCTYENINSVNVEFHDSSIDEDISATNLNIAFTLVGSANTSLVLSGDNIIGVDDIRINGTNVEIDSFAEEGFVTISLIAKEDGKIVDRDFIDVSVRDSSNAFITTWDVNAGDTVRMPTNTAGVVYNYNGIIDWGDGTGNQIFTSSSDSNFEHTFANSGVYTVSITGTFESLNNNFGIFNQFPSKLKTVESLGSVGWKTFKNAFKDSSITSFSVGNANTLFVESTYGMFKDVKNLTSLNLSSLDTSWVYDMNNMFDGANALTYLNVNGFDTSGVLDMHHMFSGVSSLTSIDGISNFDTSSVTNMQGLFGYTSSLISLNLTSWDTSKVTDMSGMFAGTSSLTSIDGISNFDTSSVTNMIQTFAFNNLSSLDLSSWDTSSVTDMKWMFEGANGLTSLDLGSWDTSNVLTMYEMFSGASLLPSLDLSSWDVSSSTTLKSMFKGASSLTFLDLSGWDLSEHCGQFQYKNNIFKDTGLINIVYDSSVNAETYGKVLSILANITSWAPDWVSFNRGSNTCGMDTVCITARDYLINDKNWSGFN